ncbi:MAG: peroxiredoxin [Cellvibrionaceae bacterium]|jgi:peroxiredoxin
MIHTGERMHTIDIGDIAPDFTLTDAMGDDYNLSTVTAQQTVVLVFYRGDWCPYCQIQLHALSSRIQQFKDNRAIFLAISPQKHELNEAFALKRGVSFPILWDEQQKVISEWGLCHELDQHQEHIPHPTTYIIGAGNKVLWRKLGENEAERPQPEEILAALPIY